jgi:hypothetical protein
MAIFGRDRKYSRTPNRVPELYASIIDAVNDRDRDYFQAHPAETGYLRRYVPGEHSPASLAAIGATPPTQDSWVLVHNVAPGIRCRRPIGRIASAGPVNGRMTIISENGVIAEDVPVVGWTGSGR